MNAARKIMLAIVPFVSISVSAEVTQFSLCTFNDGKKPAEIQAWLMDWRKLSKSSGMTYQLKILNPNAGGDHLQPGSQFGLLGTTPTLTTYGEGWDWWYSSKDAKKSRENLQSIASCGANSIWVSTD